MSFNSFRPLSPSRSFHTSKTTFQGRSKNTSGYAKRVKLNPEDSLSLQQSSNLGETLVGRLNLSNQTERVGPDSFLLQTLPAQMRETSLNNQSSLNLNKEYSNTFEGHLTNPINEEEKSKENLEGLTESFNDESEDFEKEEGSQHLSIQGSRKFNVDKHTTDSISDIERDEEDVSEAEDDEKVKLEETKKILDNSKSPVYQLVKELDVLKSAALKGELRETYGGLIKIKRENLEYFEEDHEDFFSVKFYETLILFLCCLYEEALPGLLAMEKFYEENKDFIKIGIDMNDEKVGDDDIGVLYHKIGKCYSELGNPQEGIKYLEKALLKLEESRAKDPKKQLLMNCHCSLTQHYLKYGDGEKAKVHSQRALVFVKELKNQEWGMAPINQSLSRCYINYCDALTFIGNQEKAEEKLEKAMNCLEKYLNGCGLESHHMGARIKRSQAQIAWKKRQYNSALQLYEEAIDIIEKTMPPKAKLKEDYLNELQKLKEEKEKSPKTQ